MNDFLVGALDLHVHGGPSVANRRNTGDISRGFMAAGYRGFVLKDHNIPTAGVAQVYNDQFATDRFTVFGSIVLNNSVGGLNLYAVDTSYKMGGRFVFFPTISARKHIRAMAAQGSSYPGVGRMTIREDDWPIHLLDAAGELILEAQNILKYAAQHPDMIICTGHIGEDEVEKVLEYALYLGCRKIFINHPNYIVGATIAQMQKWAGMGAYIEVNLAVLEGLSPAGVVPQQTCIDMIQALPLEQLIAVSDFGQQVNPEPAEGLVILAEFLKERCGITTEQVIQMIKVNPAKLLDLN